MSHELFANLDALPADPLLGLMSAFRADSREGKVDLGVGVYRDAAGRTPIMHAVRAAERSLAETGTTKAYEGPRGNAAFCDAILELALAESSGDRARIASLATPGGTGALGLAMSLAVRRGSSKIWISDPSWSNHAHIARTVGAQSAAYRYRADAPGVTDIDAVIDDLKHASAGDAVIVQGPCHNPSGVDLDSDGWRALAELFETRGLLPIIDVAYHGLGRSLDEDIGGVRTLWAACENVVLSYSCSKSFGLYRDRAGCLMVKADSESKAAAVLSHLADISRAYYSMPPAHGPAVVAAILGDPALTKQWRDELSEMTDRIVSLRRDFAAELAASSKTTAMNRIAEEKGMFSLLPLREGGAAQLAEQAAIYMPSFGRINIAGLPETSIADVAKKIAGVLDI